MNKTAQLKYSIIYILFFCSFLGFSQNTKVLNLSTYDYKQLHFGFSLGLNISDFRITRSYPNSDTIYVVEALREPGFNLGIVSNYRLANNLDVRFIPSLSFASRTVEFTIKNVESKAAKSVESTYIDFPFSFKYKAERINNGRAYLLGGVKFTFDMASQAKVTKSNEAIIKLKALDYHLELGFGIDCYLEYFKFAPEIKVSYGLRNMLIADNTIYSNSLEKLKSTIVLISFTFE